MIDDPGLLKSLPDNFQIHFVDPDFDKREAPKELSNGNSLKEETYIKVKSKFEFAHK